MTRTINVADNIYKLVFDKWVELRNKGNNVSLGKVADIAIERGIEFVDK